MSELQRWIEGRPSRAALPRPCSARPAPACRTACCARCSASGSRILDDDTQAVAHAKLAGGFGALFGERSEEQIALIGQLIGLDESASPHIAGIAGDGKQLRDRAFHALTQYFRLLVRERNARVVVLLDDLHWADDGSLDFIDYLAQTCRDLPMMVLCLARPALDERRAQRGQRLAQPPAHRPRPALQAKQSSTARIAAEPPWAGAGEAV
jgi:hypothetical protein